MKVKKKIIHIITALNIGGAERMLTNLVLSKENSLEFTHHIIVLNNAGIMAEKLISSGVEVRDLRMSNLFSILKSIFILYNILRTYKPNIVHTWMYHSDFLGGLIAKFSGCRNIIWSIRNTDVYRGEGLSSSTYWIMKSCAILSRYIPKKIICVSNSALNSHVKFGYDKRKCTVIENGFDLNLFQYSENNRKKIRKNFNIDDNTLVIGSIGRQNEYKDYHNLILAAEKLIIQKSNIVFFIVGVGLNNNSFFFNLVKEKRILKHFMFLGARTDIHVILSAFDIFCLHSKSEGFPNCLGEAMSIGLPCIATNVGDVRILLNNDSLIVPKKNSQLLYEKLLLLSNKSYSDRCKIGLKAKEHIIKNFAIKKIFVKYNKIYSDIINDNEKKYTY